MPAFIKKIAFLPLLSIPIAAFIFADKINEFIVYALLALAGFIVLFSVGFVLEKLDGIHNNSKIIANTLLSMSKQQIADKQMAEKQKAAEA